MPPKKLPPEAKARFALPVSSGDSFMLGVSVGIGYYKEESLQHIITLLSSTFSTPSSPILTNMQSSPGKMPARILLYADSLNAFNRMIYHRMYRSDPVSYEQAKLEEEKESEQWFVAEEGQALRAAVRWTHILRWRDVEQHSSFPNSLARVSNLYRTKEERPSSFKECGENEVLKTQVSFSEKIDSLVGRRVAANVKKIQEWNVYNLGKQIAFNSEEAVRLNREYLLHECAGEFTIVAIAEESGIYFVPQHVFYPGKINEAMLFIHQIIQDEQSKKMGEQSRSVMHANLIKVRRLEQAQSSTSSAIAESVVISSPLSLSPPSPPPVHYLPQTPTSLYGLEKFGLFNPVELNAGQLYTDISASMLELNGKFAKFQQTMLLAATLQASGKPLPPEMISELEHIGKYIEQLRQGVFSLEHSAAISNNTPN